MPSIRTDLRRKIGLDDIDSWPSAENLALAAEARSDYENKVSAIKQYATGASLCSIKDSTGISRQHLHYLIKRCELPDEEGRPQGFPAILKGKHLTKLRRSAPEKLTAGRALPGALQGLFARYPELRKTMYDLVVHGHMPNSKREHFRRNWQTTHEVFTDECLKLGLCAPHYPFSSESQGFVSLVRWGRKLRKDKQQKDQLSNLIATEDGEWSRPRDPPSRCFGKVECDGHYIDLDWVIETPSLNGEGVVRIRVKRLWLIALIETKSTAVIGYSIALGKNYSAADIARAINSSLNPWKPRNLSVSTIAYKPGECLPNALDPRLAYVCYDEIWLDNAKSHLSDLFLTVLERTVNAVPVFGPRKAPNVRPRIELLFDLLEEAGIHTLDGTTGSNHQDSRKATAKDDPYILTLDVVLDLIDLLVVRYNTGIAPGTTISRLDVLRRALDRETSIFRRIPNALQEKVAKYDLFEIATIRSDRGQPVLRWHDARYKGQGLLSRPGLMDQEVLVMANSMDLRLIEVALTKDGTPLGVLEVEPRWRSTPHSIWTRRQVRKAMTHSSFLQHAADIPRAFRKHAEMEAKKGAVQKTLLAKLAREQEGIDRSSQSCDKEDQIETAESASIASEALSVSEGASKLLNETPVEAENDELDEILRRLGTVYR